MVPKCAENTLDDVITAVGVDAAIILHLAVNALVPTATGLGDSVGTISHYAEMIVIEAPLSLGECSVILYRGTNTTDGKKATT